MEEALLIYDYLNTFTKKGVMLDVGAYRGTSALPFLENGWQVYAFEPDCENRKLLAPLVKKYPNLNIQNMAVSDACKTNVPIYRSKDIGGISSLTPFHSTHVESARIQQVTLDSFCAANEIDSVDFLKIDAEGHDLFVLKGFPWERLEPSVVLCEFEDRKTVRHGYTVHGMAHYLMGQGYEIIVSEWFPIVEYGAHHVWKGFQNYPCPLIDDKGWGNLIAFREAIDWAALLTTETKRYAAMNKTLERKRRYASKCLAEIRNSKIWRLGGPLRATIKTFRR